MSLRLEMLQVARLAPTMLGDSSNLVAAFLKGRQGENGGFVDRNGQEDLYYSVFGIEGLLALQADWESRSCIPFLESFTDLSALDFVHLSCLARCWASIAQSNRDAPVSQDLRDALADAILAYRTPDGGFHPLSDQSQGTAYGAFLSLGAFLDLGRQMPDPLELVRSLKCLETPDGAWANERGAKQGATNATAAAVTVLRNLDMPIAAGVIDWLFAQVHPQGGFLAMPRAPIPDLLSTATALHALSGLQAPLQPLKEHCLDFIDTLWVNEGSFYGHWHEDALDTEYTYYGLLALGHLSL